MTKTAAKPLLIGCFFMFVEVFWSAEKAFDH